MSLEVVCPECGRSLLVNQRMAGRSLRCPDCDAVVTVPHDAPAAEPIIEPAAGEVVPDAPFAAIPLADEAPQAIASEPVMSAEPVPVGESVSSGRANEHAESVIFHDVEAEEVQRRTKRLDDDEVDMTAMVDVTFLLLIFFMVTASFSLQKSIQMPRQTTDQPSFSAEEIEPEDLDLIELEIDEFGSFLVMAADWERPTPGKQNLINTLREAIGNRRDGMKLNIKVHELAKLQALVDGMDAATIAGFAEIQVAQVEDFN